MVSDCVTVFRKLYRELSLYRLSFRISSTAIKIRETTENVDIRNNSQVAIVQKNDIKKLVLKKSGIQQVFT